MKSIQKKDYVVLAIVVMAIITITAIPVMAALVQKEITVSTGINIYVDDVKLNPVDANGKPVEVFIYNGTTYLPARAVSTAVGKPINWDGKTQSIYIGKHDSEEPVAMLSDLDYFDAGLKFTHEKEVKDNLGNTYFDALTTNSYSDGWQTYKINGMYSKMKGRIILPYEYRTINYESRIKIYCDDKLKYTSPVITGGVEPVDFSVDLTGVLTLKVEMTGTSYRIISLVDVGLYQ